MISLIGARNVGRVGRLRGYSRQNGGISLDLNRVVKGSEKNAFCPTIVKLSTSPFVSIWNRYSLAIRSSGS